MSTKKATALIALLMISLLFNSSCVKDSKYATGKKAKTESVDLKPLELQLLEKEKAIAKEKQEPSTEQEKQSLEKEEQIATTEIKDLTKLKKKDKVLLKKIDEAELDFQVQNLTGRTIYVVCFSYIQKRYENRWRWDKSDIYEIKNNEMAAMDIDTIPDKKNRENVYGYLAVFNNQKQAADSVYELLDDKDKIDLDLLYKLKNIKVIIEIEKYGIKGDLLSYDFLPISKKEQKPPELDFIIKNQTEKTVYITCFIYQTKEDMPVWRYDKTSVKKLEPNAMAIMDVDTISQGYDRVYMRGYMAIFDNEKEAEDSTFELLKPKNKILLGRIILLQNKVVVLEVEKYGIIEDKIDFKVRPVNKIDFEKVLTKK